MLKSLHKTPTVLSALLCAVVLLGGLAHAQAKDADHSDEDNPLATVTRLIQGVDADIAALQASNRSARRQLRADEHKLRAADITPARLQQAQLDVSAAHTQLDNIDTRLAARKDNVESLERRIDEQRAAQETGTAPTGDQQALETGNKLLEELESLVAKLTVLRDATHWQELLAQRRLELLQQRFNVDYLRAHTGPDPQREAIRRAIDGHISHASALRAQLRGVRGTTPAAAARKRLLQIRIFDASERAELKSTELALLDRSRAVAQLSNLSDNQAMPEGALRKARKKMTGIRRDLESRGDALTRKLAVIKGQRDIVDQRGAIAEGDDATLARQQRIVDKLRDDVAAQNQRVNDLIKTAQAADQRFETAIARVSRQELIKHRRLPEDARAWRALGADLTTLPARVLANLADAVRAVWQRVVMAGVLQWGLLVVLEGLLIAGIVWLRRFLDRTLIKKDLARGAVLPMCALYWTLPQLVPAAALIVLGLVLGVSTVNLTLLLALLLIWPAVKFSLKMSFYLLVDEAPAESLAVRTRLYRELQWVLSLVGLIAGLSVIAQVVALSPRVVDVVERFTMICLLLVALPALHVRRVILTRSDKDMRQAGFWIRLAGALSLLVPIVLIGCALLGVVGYVPLAAAVTVHLGWLAVVTAGWLLAESAVRDGARWLSRRAAAKAGENADFWDQNIIGPAYKIVALALAILAGFILFKIFGWSEQTPVIRLLPDLMNTALFTVGKTTIHVRELAIAALVVLGVFWMGSWSKQVSYKFAYVRISDYGIRQSLSTFTQYTVVVIGLYIALKSIGLDLTALTVFAGALGVGIGFGLQNITSNFISGILLLIERPLRVSDIVHVEGVDGTVTHIGIRALKLRTFEHQEVVVPNSSVITKPFTNWTGDDDIYRTMFYVRVGYDSDPHQAVELIGNIVNAHKAVAKTPAPKVVLNDFTESCMLIRVQYFSHVLGRVGLLDIRSQVLFAIWDALRQAGIQIPFPQQDVHIKQLSGSAGPA